VAFWLGLALLAIGIVIALLGVRAAVASYERGQDLERYAHASTRAHYAASTGADAVAAGKKLLALNRSEATAAPELRRLILARNSSAYNSRNESIDRDLSRKQELTDKIETLDKRLSQALAPSSSP
jgi:hypothetical protein